MFLCWRKGIVCGVALIWGLTVACARQATASSIHGKASQSPAKSLRKQVESLVVDVNGERRRITPEDGLDIVRGDLVTFVDVISIPAGDTKFALDLIGFNDGSSGSGNDIEKVIDTADLQRGKMLKGGKSRFNIRVSAHGAVSSGFFMTMAEPELRSFEIEVNAQRFRKTSTDRLALAASDQVRVLEVRTNVRGNENVKYDLVTKDWADGRPRKELRFSRGDIVFARIPIDWKGS